MYKYKSGQISITDFGQPMGMHLNENNRWVKKAAMIPWNEIEKRYAGLFKSHKGHPAKPLRLALGACMIQAEYGYSDEEITLQIQESPYLQYFCGYEAYDDSKPPFDSSSMVYFRKRLTPEILGFLECCDNPFLIIDGIKTGSTDRRQQHRNTLVGGVRLRAHVAEHEQS